MKKFFIKLLKWLIHLGKVKGSIIFFILTSTTFLLINSISAIFQHFFPSNLFIQPNSFLLPVLIIALISTSFYTRAVDYITEQELLNKKGLNSEDIKRISFVRTWDKIRNAGIKRFCFYNGGVILGIVFLLPIMAVGLISYLFVNYGLSFDITKSNLVFFIIVSYFLGVGIYYLKWRLNERRFIRLTNPVN
jgi:hypothetical protein